MKTVAEQMRETLNLLEKTEPGFVKPPPGWWENHDLEEFREALRLYTRDAWQNRGLMDQADIVSVFDKSLPPMDRSVQVWRGMAFESWDSMEPEADFRNRTEIDFGLAYVSTSHSWDVGNDFLAQCPVSQCFVYVLFKITTKAGARGADVEFLLDGEDYGEAELILDRVSMFKVVSKTKRAGEDAKEIWDVELEQIK